MFCPVTGKFTKRNGAEDEGRGGQGSKVAIKRSYRLENISMVSIMIEGSLLSHPEKRGPGASVRRRDPTTLLF